MTQRQRSIRCAFACACARACAHALSLQGQVLMRIFGTSCRYRYNPWRAPGYAPIIDACGQVRTIVTHVYWHYSLVGDLLTPLLFHYLSLSLTLSLSLSCSHLHTADITHIHTHTHTHTHTHRLVESTSRRRLAVTLCTRPQSMQQWATSGPRCSPRVQQARLGLPVLRFKSRGECGTIMEEVRELLAAARTSTIHTSFILHLRTKRFHSRTIMVLPPEVASIGDYVLIRVFFFSVHAVFFGHISSCTIPSVSAYSPPLSLSLSL